ncbi:MAG TPA: helix-turn-helix transcriptional regulator [Candidatus Limnocylindrales bacterium]
MVTTGGPLPLLTRWGLSPDADLVFRTLTMFGPQTASGLERDLGISRHRVDRALSDLDDAGAAAPAVQSGLKERRWCARSSEETMHGLRRWRHRPPRRPGPRTDPVAVSRRAVDGIELGNGLRHLTSRNAARLRMAELVAIIQYSHVSMNPEASFEPASMKAAAPLDNLLQARGVQTRMLGVTQADPDLLLPYGGIPKEALPTYRQAESLPMKLIIVDRKVAVFPVEPSNLEQGYLEVSQPPVVDALALSFEQYWAAAHDLSETVMPAFELSPREHAIVTLLTLGHTDAGVARELRISERSVSNILRSMMDRLGVDNRFQLGVALGTLQIAPLPPGMPATRRNGNGNGNGNSNGNGNGESN